MLDIRVVISISPEELRKIADKMEDSYKKLLVGDKIEQFLIDSNDLMNIYVMHKSL